MRLLVCSVGTHGDVQPAVALAAGLQAAGHEVRFATHSAFEGLTRAAGIELVSLGGNDPRQVMRDVQHGTIGKSTRLRLFKHLFRRHAPSPEELARQVEICRGHDFVLTAIGSFHHAAESLGIPSGALALYPTQSTGSFPHHLSRLYRSWGGPVNRLSHFAIQQLFWQPDREWVNAWRRDLGLAPLSWAGPAAHLRRRRIPHFFGYSPAVIPRPADWPEWFHVSGFWFWDKAGEFNPPGELIRFLEAGPPPVVIGFGSLVDPDPEGLRRILLEAISAAGERGLILSGWGGNAGGSLPPNVFQADWVPLPWLLSRARAIVHHSGAGTLSEALRAGVPSVTVPYSGEQKFWASRLHALAAAPKPIPRLKLSAPLLADAIRLAVTAPRIRERARELARVLQAEHGVARTVAAIDREVRSALRQR